MADRFHAVIFNRDPQNNRDIVACACMACDDKDAAMIVINSAKKVIRPELDESAKSLLCIFKLGTWGVLDSNMYKLMAESREAIVHLEWH